MGSDFFTFFPKNCLTNPGGRAILFTERKEKEIKKMKKLLASLAFFVIITVICAVFVVIPAKRYNHGTCPDCHKPYKEVRAISNGNSYTKFRCEECGKWGIVLDWVK